MIEPRARILYLLSILERQTDEAHPLSTNELIALLRDTYGIPMHRTTVKSDITVLQNYGIDIEEIRSKNNQYYVPSRLFELPELKLLCDAVESSKFITEKKSMQLIEKLATLTSVHQAQEIQPKLYAGVGVKPTNEHIYYILDTVQQAIRLEKKVSFLYFEYDVSKEKHLKNDGKPYIFSPYASVWNGDFYYMLGYCDKHCGIGAYRMDRILCTPQILEENAVPAPPDFAVGKYTKSAFQMYGGHEECTVELRCENSLMKFIIDKFSEDVEVTQRDTNSFCVRVDVALSLPFYGWVFGFGKKMQILSPMHAKAEYTAMARAVLEEDTTLED